VDASAANQKIERYLTEIAAWDTKFRDLWESIDSKDDQLAAANAKVEKLRGALNRIEDHTQNENIYEIARQALADTKGI